MPVMHARSETRGRPPFVRRGRIGKNGSTRSHNASGSNAAAIAVHTTSPERNQFLEVLLHALSVSWCLRVFVVNEVSSLFELLQTLAEFDFERHGLGGLGLP
jgi:hypothetical protein